MIKIYYTIFNKELKDATFQRYLDILPNKIKGDILKYNKWNDKYACLFGKLLLKKGLREMSVIEEIDKVQFTEYGRPYLNNSIDFNISHSFGCVICAFTDEGKIGIDVENIEPIDLSHFETCFSNNEWNDIRNSNDIFARFFHYWTKKEAVTKADGRGLSIPLSNFEVMDDFVCLNDKTWNIKLLEIDDAYKVHLVCSKNQNVELIKVDFYSNEDTNERINLSEESLKG